MSDPAAPRLYALDNLRAIMMWLGIVLHAAVIHMVGPTVLPWKDERRTAAADILVGFIHAFRMPVFFLLAGFFVALLVRKLGADGMVRHRMRRLLLPFVIFWPLLYLAIGVAAVAFVHRIHHGGAWGFDPALVPREGREGPNTIHLWFLWMLVWYGAAAGALWRFGPRLAPLGALLQRVGARWWGFAVLALPPVFAGQGHPNGLLVPTGSFLPPWNEWLHHGVFFVFGIVLFAHQQELFALYQRRWRAYAAAGLPFFMLIPLLAGGPRPELTISFAYNAAAWLWSFAWIGLALRVLERRHALLAWMADSAYWVYLVHMPLTVLFGAMLYGLPLPALVKMTLNIALTTAVCLATYAGFVRGGRIGRLLNGRRDAPSGLPAPAPG